MEQRIHLDKNNVIEKEIDYNKVTEMESVCMRCFKKGITRFLLLKIPFFKDIIVMSFECDDKEKCGFMNNEIQSGNDLADTGVKYTLKVSQTEDLQRMVVANMRSLVYIPEIDFEVPDVKKGVVSTLSGMFQIFIEDLEMDQKERKEKQPEVYHKIQDIIHKLTLYKNGDQSILPFHFVMDDAAGNSFISNPFAPLKDVNLKEERYVQTKEHLYKLGYVSDAEMAMDKELKKKKDLKEDNYKEYDKTLPKQNPNGLTDKDIHNMMKKMQGANKKKDAHKLDYSKTLQEQDVDFLGTVMKIGCYVCGKEGEMRSCTCEIPFFKEMIIMSFLCEECGYKNVEIKTGGAISEKGKKITLFATTKDDLDRDIFKSESAIVRIEELDFEMMAGTLGSFYTTVEGLLVKIIDNLSEKNPFVGDSADPETKKKFLDAIQELKDCKNGKKLPFTLIINDPLDNCFILNPNYPKEDPRVIVEEYERSAKLNNELGIDYLMELEKQEAKDQKKSSVDEPKFK